MPDYERDYALIAGRVTANGTSEERMRCAADALWAGLRNAGVSWLGFYVQDSNPEQLILGPCCDKPACSPIGLHGVCGQALLTGQSRIVRDVTELGPDYIACDPRDRSEIVVPLRDETGTVSAVLDVDSWEVGAFDERDDVGLRRVLQAAGLMQE
jgi:putative methionine-R-sulfoxide reductase with GAF domain